MTDTKYLETHEWYKISDNTFTVGISDFAQGELGDIVYVEVETLNENLNSEEVFGTVEAVKTVSDLFMPISGEIIEYNENLIENPELINSDPYNQGWIIKVKPTELKEVDSLINFDEYKKIIGT